MSTAVPPPKRFQAPVGLNALTGSDIVNQSGVQPGSALQAYVPPPPPENKPSAPTSAPTSNAPTNTPYKMDPNIQDLQDSYGNDVYGYKHALNQYRRNKYLLDA